MKEIACHCGVEVILSSRMCQKLVKVEGRGFKTLPGHLVSHPNFYFRVPGPDLTGTGGHPGSGWVVFLVPEPGPKQTLSSARV